MEKFSEFKYVRPDLEKIKKELKIVINSFNKAESAKDQVKLYKDYVKIMETYDSMHSIASIRYSVNTKDQYYKEENEYLAEIGPYLQDYSNQMEKLLVNSQFRSELEKELGKLMFLQAQQNLKTFSTEIVEDLQEENRLVLKYRELMGSAQVEYKGEKRTLSQLAPFMIDKDRYIRKESSELYFGFMDSHKNEFDNLYDKLVKLRDKIAKKLGFSNFIELGYLRMGRVDYNDQMVKIFRESILENVVPLNIKLREKQKFRLGLDKLKYYDLSFKFNNGNPKPKGDSNWIIDKAKKMYKELSDETDQFFNFMLNHELMDLESKDGKAPGGYCTYINSYRAPFIFSNFNGTQGDVEVLTHEIGHAFQVFRSRDLGYAYLWPTYEACEIHSMSMEFLTYPWMKDFFEEDVEKFKYSHLEGNLLFYSYGAAVDEFQHEVYINPELTSDDRNKLWRKIEKKYQPVKDYDGNEYLENGGFWQKQGHIFEVPFYYIDYTLALTCALQFYISFVKDKKETWKRYLDLCDLGGSKSFVDLIKSAGLRSPFEKKCLKEIVNEISVELEKIDISKF